jgi:hypothetical protein
MHADQRITNVLGSPDTEHKTCSSVLDSLETTNLYGRLSE